MWGDFFYSGAPGEVAWLYFIFAAMGFAIMSPLVWIAGKIVALRDKPDKRAFTTVITAYAVASLVFIFGSGNAISPLSGPLVPLPGAVVIFFWLRGVYRRAWVDDDKVSDEIDLQNDDWRVGAIIVLGLLAVAITRAFFRMNFTAG